MNSRWLSLYTRAVLDRPWVTIAAAALVVAVFASQIPSFRLDASSDSLVLEVDDPLRTYREIRERYGSDDYLIVTYTPSAAAGALFDSTVLGELRELRNELAALERVASVVSILDVPLVESPPVSLSDLREGTPTLDSPGTDLALAQRELLTSPIYRDLLISDDARTTALLVQFDTPSPTVNQGGSDGSADDDDITPGYDASAEQQATQRDVAAVREILDRHRAGATLHLGGVPMIVADSIDFIRSDLVSFGTGVVALLIVLLLVAFRALRWVALPLLTCLAVGSVMLGFLGWSDWPVTVVSSNFLSLLLIITLSLTIHLVVSYQELHGLDPQANSHTLVVRMVEHKALPCIYTALTTAVAFGSLIVSEIRPVIDFGWMMVVGIFVALAFAFTFFPAALVTMRPPRALAREDFSARAVARIGDLLEARGGAVLAIFAVSSLVLAAGLTRLSVENRFIDYFDESTEIYQGMVLIDRELGGTTPLDVIVDAPRSFHQARAEERAEEEDADFEDDEFMLDDFGDPGITGSSYWFNTAGLEEAERIHEFLDGLPESGKVLSLSTAIEMLERIDPEALADDILLSILYDKLPDELRETLIVPYYSEEAHQLRFSVRVFESDPSLVRGRMLETIRRHLHEELGLAHEQVQLTGMVVLYNNMLQSLYRSQILTVGVVFVAIWVLFAIVFRSLRVASIAVIPNVFAALSVLGLMGWLGIRLDLMTITIAALSIGIGVDDTIHYVHRMRDEFAEDRNSWAAVHRSHRSVGKALLYTTLAVALGFSILVLSNFVPTVYFGLLTGLAMLTALAADLSLLPLLLVRWHPFGEEAGEAG